MKRRHLQQLYITLADVIDALWQQIRPVFGQSSTQREREKERAAIGR